MMYAHVADRYRIIQRLIRMERELSKDNRISQMGMSQQALARSSGAKQSTISNLENLERSVDVPKRRVSREEMLRVLTLGLSLDQEKVDGLLWLFDGQPLNEKEIKNYVINYQAEAYPETYSESELRRIVLNHLEELLQHYGENGARSAKQATIINTGSQHVNRQAMDELAAVEQQPGQRMLLARHPSFVTFPDNAYPTGMVAQETITEFRELNQLRLENLGIYGERCIHFRGNLESYIDRGPNFLSREDRKRQIARWIELLTEVVPEIWTGS